MAGRGNRANRTAARAVVHGLGRRAGERAVRSGGVAQRKLVTCEDGRDIEIPRDLTHGLKDEQVNEMVRVALSLTPLWENALGKDWQQQMTPEVARELLTRM